MKVSAAAMTTNCSKDSCPVAPPTLTPLRLAQACAFTQVHLHSHLLLQVLPFPGVPALSLQFVQVYHGAGFLLLLARRGLPLLRRPPQFLSSHLRWSRSKISASPPVVLEPLACNHDPLAGNLERVQVQRMAGGAHLPHRNRPLALVGVRRVFYEVKHDDAVHYDLLHARC